MKLSALLLALVIGWSGLSPALAEPPRPKPATAAQKKKKAQKYKPAKYKAPKKHKKPARAKWGAKQKP